MRDFHAAVYTAMSALMAAILGLGLLTAAGLAIWGAYSGRRTTLGERASMRWRRTLLRRGVFGRVAQQEAREWGAAANGDAGGVGSRQRAA